MKKILLFLILFLLIPINTFSALKGDVDGNNKVNTSDYIKIRKHLINMPKLTGEELIRADVNSDGKINAADYNAVRKIILKIDTSDSKNTVINDKYEYIIANVNVLDYGADATGKKDSTDAFKKAINNAGAGGVVYAPKGIYLIKDTLDLPTRTILIGSLKEGTADGTILAINHSSGTTSSENAAIKMTTQSMVKNIAFWYPNQSANGSRYTVKYPPTILQTSIEGLAIENVNFINSYIAMDFASDHENDSIQFLKDIYGAPMTGIINDTNLDTLKIINLNFHPKYWTNSGLSNIPSQKNINDALYNIGVGIILERVDWYFLTGINISNYNVGIHLRKSLNRGFGNAGLAEGELYDAKLTDCRRPLYMENSKHLVITNSKITASDNIGAIGISKDSNCNISINNSEISGQTAISNSGKVNISITGSKINGKITRSDTSSKISFINDNLTNTGYDNASVKESAKSPASVTYNKKVVTKPTSNKLIEINNMSGKDITNKLKSAINELKGTGGIIYIPVGSYTISDHIDVYAGIEIRGANPLPHHYSGSGLTKLKTKYSKKVLFTLYDNSGLNGLSIIYTEQNVTKYPYTILGKGSNIYIKNIALANSWKGIDLATNQCDNHYVEHIWGYAFEKGITVGGNSKNGYIGSCHLTSNALYNRKEGDILKYTFEHLTAFEVGNSKNEVLVNNFVYAPNIGYHISSGADNFTFIGAGADNCNNTALYLTGKINGQVINQLLATFPKTSRGDITMGINPTERSYIRSKGVSGSINIVNSMAWNNPNGKGYSLDGTAKIDIYGGLIDAASSPVINNSNSTLSICGVIIKPTVSPIIKINSGTTSLRSSGNICVDKACSKTIQNNAGITVSINENGIK